MRFLPLRSKIKDTDLLWNCHWFLHTHFSWGRSKIYTRICTHKRNFDSFPVFHNIVADKQKYLYICISKSTMSPSDMPTKVTLVLGAQRAVGAGEGCNPTVSPHVDIKWPSVIIWLGTQRALEEFADVRWGMRRHNKSCWHLGRDEC